MMPDTAVQHEECSVVDFDACTGIVPDITGDIKAGRTTFIETSEDFLDHLMSLRREE